MKILYRICKVCSFFIILIFVSSVLVFMAKKPKEIVASKDEELVINEKVIQKRIVEGQITYYLYSDKEINEKYAVSVAFCLFEDEKQAFLFLVEDEIKYLQVSVNNECTASIVVAIK